MTRIIIRVAIIVALLAVGLAAGLGYGYLRLGKEQQVHSSKVNELNRKISMLQKRATEEREARSVAEGRDRSLQGEIDKLKKENAESAEQLGKLKAAGQALEAKQKETTEELARTKTANSDLNAQLAQVLQAAKELQEQSKLLASGKQTLETSLTKVNQDLDTCRTHNAKLCILADEILKQQQAGSRAGAIFHSEPLTQIGKVDLEKFAQEYKEKIDQEKVKATK